MLEGKSLLDYTNLFSPNECEKNETKTKISVINRYKKGGDTIWVKVT